MCFSNSIALATVVVVISAVVIFSDGSKVGKGKNADRKDTDVQEIFPISNDSIVDDTPTKAQHATLRRVRKANVKVHKKLRNAKRKKFKSKHTRGKAKSRNPTKLGTAGNDTAESYQVKKKLKRLALKRSKTQTKTLPSLARKHRPEQDNGCGKCNPLECPSFDAMVQYCPSGVVKDKCGCCAQCASSVGMPCHTTASPLKWITPCGNDLECLPAATRGSDITQARSVRGPTVSLEGICVCVKKVAVCSTDEVTYEDICEFREAAFRQSMITGLNISISHHGPCRSAPKINSKPTDVTADEGKVVSFRCEISGFPLPKVQWIKKGGNSETGRDLDLPGYLNHAVTQIRGGPRKYQLTTWLTLDQVREDDNGVYICRSSNYYGIADAPASLHVTGK